MKYRYMGILYCTLSLKQGTFPSDLLECIREQVLWQVNFQKILSDINTEKYQEPDGRGMGLDGDFNTPPFRKFSWSWAEGGGGVFQPGGAK